ncbi:cytochrome P450 [Kitasatospora sp. NPDC002227]|uniref:cytochrome P450 n=1 Tax=Kitasatospora sp. NPDC002227 TaxID=3154773 RepID=UPI00331FC619
MTRPAEGGGTASPLGPEFLARPAAVLAAYREGACPVARVRTPAGRPVWLVTRESDVRAGFTDPRLSLATTGPAPGRPHRALDRTLVSYDPPDHTRIRRLAAPAFTPGRIAVHRLTAERLADGLLGALAAEGRPVELMAEFAEPFAFAVLCEVFGFRPEAGRALRRAAADLLAHRETEAALDTLDRTVRAELADRRARPGGADVVSLVLRAWETSGEVTEAELVDLVAMLVLAGFDSTVQTIGLAVLALLTHPEQYGRLKAEPGLTANAVDELLRWDTPGPFATLRTALADVPVGGAVIPAGSGVLLAVTSANRDQRAHPEPDRLDLARPGAARHLTFGAGPHYCPGAALARIELAAALRAFATHWPHARLTGPPPQHGGGHQHRRLTALRLVQDGSAARARER